MERLTKNNDTQYDFIGRYDTNIEEFSNNKELRVSVMNKLGQLEDIEEELGIDLITLFKALKNGVSDSNNEYSVHLEYKRNGFCLLPVYEDMEMYAFDFKDYGKTWALTKEELEK